MTQKQQIQIFEEKKVRTVWDDETQQWYFSIADAGATKEMLSVIRERKWIIHMLSIAC